MDVAATANAESGSERPSTEREANGVQENKFTRAISAWRNIDLTKLIPTLDTTASDLVAHQRDALTERKELAQKTKDFRKLEDAAKLSEIKGLLKAYQAYIDLVSNQNKTVSSTFLNIYSSLSEAPDPYPLLEASIESLVVADERVPQLESENQQLYSSNNKLTAQLETVEQQLEDERKSRQELEQSRDAKIQEVEQSWSNVLTEKQDNWSAREKSLEERVANQDRLLKELKASYEVSQRLWRTGEDGEEGAAAGGASLAELEIVQSDLDRANARLAEVETRNEKLRLQLAQSTTQDVTRRVPVEEDPAYLRLRSENTTIMRRSETARFEQEAALRELDASNKQMRREINALKEDSDTLRAKVKRWGDYDDIRRELEVLKSIEFSVDNADEDDGLVAAGGTSTPAASSTSTAESQSAAQNLEHLLLNRNKKLNNELTVLRVSHQDLARRLEAVQDELSNTNMALERSRTLNATLENDLSRMQEEAAHVAPAMSVAGYSARYPTSGSRRGRATSPTSSIISGFDNRGGASPTLESLRAGEPVGGGSGMMPMIIAQRDRFKKRITDLEAELSKTYATVQSLRSEVGALQKDNLGLYEKARFHTSYAGGGGAPTSPRAAGGARGGGSSGDAQIQIHDTNPLERYSSAYESRLSPFAAFKGRESARAYRQMLLPEKALLQFTKAVLATRASRNLFATYLVAVHLLLVYVSLHDGCQGRAIGVPGGGAVSDSGGFGGGGGGGGSGMGGAAAAAAGGGAAS